MLVTVLLIALAGGIFYVSTHRSGTTGHLCQTSLPIRHVGDRTVAVETKATDGGTCRVGKTNVGIDTLGLDCKVRSPNGKVVETLVAPGEDATC